MVEPGESAKMSQIIVPTEVAWIQALRILYEDGVITLEDYCTCLRRMKDNGI